MMTGEQQTRAAELKAAIASTATSASGTAPEVRRAAVALKPRTHEHVARAAGVVVVKGEGPCVARAAGVDPGSN